MKRRTSLSARAFFIALNIIIWSAGSVLAQQAFPANQVTSDVFVEDVEIQGNRRIPRESILYYVQTKPQDRFDPAQAQRDLQAILQMGLFDPLATKLLTEDGNRGGKIVIFRVKEYPIIRALEYRGLKSATESEILTRWKERRVNVSKEATFDPAKTNSARLVIRELLAEKGHPDAKVDVEVEEISATTVALIFDISEGPRVRVKSIQFVGDTDKFSQRRLRGAMKLVKESGFFSTFTSKDIYFKEKLLDDLNRVQYFLGTKGYLQAKFGEPAIENAGKATSGLPIPLPLLSKSGPGLKVTIPVEVGRRYKIKSVTEKGVSIFQPNVVKAISGLREGEWIDAKKIQENIYKGIKDYYGIYGYIQAEVAFIPKFIDTTPEEGEVEVTLEVDEGRQFALRRLEFIGNTNTRDVVLRREILVNEGDPYNKRYWDLSILRLNQLGLFDEIKEKDAITRTDDRNQTVDIDLQVKEKGRQQIQLNGGVSGFAGSFFGIEYSTNNFLGYGETLSVALSGGNRQMYAQFGFTEPYFMGKQVSLGFNLFTSKTQFIGSGFNFSNSFDANSMSIFGLSSVDSNTLFTQKTYGGSLSLQAPLGVFTKRFEKLSRFARLGLTYSLASNLVQDPDVNRDNDRTNDIPVSFSSPRIVTSRITPSFYYNSKNAYLDPTNGQSILLAFSMGGGILGGDVNTFSPSFEYQRFMPVLRRRTEKPHVVAMRFRADHIRTFGSIVNTDSLSFVGGVPIYERFFLGGENDVRGYNFRSIGPVVPYRSFAVTQNVVASVPNPAEDPTPPFIPPSTDPVSNTFVDPNLVNQFTGNAPLMNGCGIVSSPGCNILPAGSLFTPIGGDTQFILNLEYRVPIISVLSVAAFADLGTTFNARKYKDQVVQSKFVGIPCDQPNNFCTDVSGLAPIFGGVPILNFNGSTNGVILNGTATSVDPSRGNGSLATAADLAAAADADNDGIKDDDDGDGAPNGFRRAFFVGESRNYSIINISEGRAGLLNDLRSSLVSSMGAEVRVQMPVINVPFRLIFGYNPQARTDITDPRTLFIERKKVIRFSVGRTF
ncbi:MAG: outer membrane protein assembly factor BamA [Acidobacteria bacterium]|nr:outer membrane protein assembly factor BamA [Acidobacteriota bacterium]